MADRPAQRAGALIMALVFFISTVALTGYVIWQVQQGNKNKKVDDVGQTAIDAIKAQAPKDTSKTNKEAKLEGTKLKDFTPVEKIDTLSSTDPVAGTGQELKAGDTVTAHYTGALAKDGTIFQSSHDGGQPFTSPLSGLIKGWQQGLLGMKVGGTRRLMIPADLAYGSQAQSGIPANSDLVFDIELVSIGK